MNGFVPRPFKPDTTTAYVPTEAPSTAYSYISSANYPTESAKCIIPFGANIIGYGLTSGVMGAIILGVIIFTCLYFIIPGQPPFIIQTLSSLRNMLDFNACVKLFFIYWKFFSRINECINFVILQMRNSNLTEKIKVY